MLNQGQTMSTPERPLTIYLSAYHPGFTLKTDFLSCEGSNEPLLRNSSPALPLHQAHDGGVLGMDWRRAGILSPVSCRSGCSEVAEGLSEGLTCKAPRGFINCNICSDRKQASGKPNQGLCSITSPSPPPFPPAFQLSSIVRYLKNVYEINKGTSLFNLRPRQTGSSSPCLTELYSFYFMVFPLWSSQWTNQILFTEASSPGEESERPGQKKA